jgi:hypothetical protein
MDKPEEIVFTIPKPCHEDWDKMEPNSRGRHCTHCSKTVVDATHLNPEEIFKIYKKQKGNACMRLRADMIDTSHQIPASKWYSFATKYYRRAAVFIGMQLLFFNQVKAQVKDMITQDKNSDGVVKKYLKSVKISGTVADSLTGEPIPYPHVSVILGGRNIGGTIGSFEGAYTIDLTDSVEENGPATLEFKGLNYDVVMIKDFRFNKLQIVIDTIFLNKRATELKEIEIRSVRQQIIIQGAFIGVVIHPQQHKPNYSPAALDQLQKLIRPMDPSPRNTNLDLWNKNGFPE